MVFSVGNGKEFEKSSLSLEKYHHQRERERESVIASQSNTFTGVVQVLWLAASLLDDASALRGLALLLLLQFLGGLLAQQ